MRKLTQNLIKKALGVYLKKEGRLEGLFDLLRTEVAGEERKRACLRELSLIIERDEHFLLPSLEVGSGRDSDRSYQLKYVDFGIKEGDRVLDVGSGGYPFPYATDLVDLYPGDTAHRAESLVRDGRPFNPCNIEGLPYGGKEFDFVYCSHVLEHVPDPARACDELMRVGKRGYIETPTRMSDIMFNFTALKDHHRWHVHLSGSTLFFFEWGGNERRDVGTNDFFRMFVSKYKNQFQDMVHRNRDLFNNMLLWDGSFFYYVFDKNGSLVSTNAMGETGKTGRSIAR